MSTLEEQFRRQDEKAPSRRRTVQERRVTRPHTEDEDDQNDEIDEYDNDKVLDDALARVLALAGTSESDMDVLIRSIESARDIRFGLFRRIGELEAEAMTNETKILDMEKEVRRLQRHEMNSGTRRLRDQHAIEERRSRVEKKIEDVEAQQA